MKHVYEVKFTIEAITDVLAETPEQAQNELNARLVALLGKEEMRRVGITIKAPKQIPDHN